MSTLQYQSLVYAAGQSFVCVESYESVFQRVREASWRMEAEDADSGLMTFPGFIELTVRGEHGPLRLALNPTTIAGVLELHENDRVEVDGG